MVLAKSKLHILLVGQMFLRLKIKIPTLSSLNFVTAKLAASDASSSINLSAENPPTRSGS